MQDEIVVEDNSNTSEDTAPEAEVETVDEDIDWKSEAEKAKELAKNYKIRAEKAEREKKESVKQEPSKEKVENVLTPKDTIALMKANINEDDIDDIVDYAKYKGIPVTEALKTTTVKSMLAEKEEFRASANAANVNNTKRGVAKLSDDSLISNARSGKLPESDDEIARLMRAKRDQSKNS